MTHEDSTAARRPQMGRPPQPVETTRRNRVVTMVTDAELNKLSSIADAEKQSLSSLVRLILASYLHRRK